MIKLVRQTFRFSSFTVKNVFSRQVMGQYSTPQLSSFLQSIYQHKQIWKHIKNPKKEEFLAAFIDKLNQQHNFSHIAQLLSGSTGKEIGQCHSELFNTISIMKYQMEALKKENRTLQKKQYRFEPFDLSTCIFSHRQPLLAGLSYLPLALLSDSPLLLRPSPKVLPPLQKISKLWLQTCQADIFRLLPQNIEDPKQDNSVVSSLLNSTQGFISYWGRLKDGLDFHYFISQSNQVFRQSQFLLTSSDSAYIMKDLSKEQLQKAAKIVARGCYSNCGHSFNSIKRVFVDREIHNQFQNIFLEEMKKYKIDLSLLNDPDNIEHNLGTLAPFVIKEEFQQSIALIKEIKQKHSEQITLVEGGQQTVVKSKQSQLNFISPTLFRVQTDFPSFSYQSIECMMPVCFMSIVESPQNCIQKINSSIFGTTASIFTNNIDSSVIQQFGSKLEVGTVNVNTWQVTSGIAYGGRKRSGKGFSIYALCRQNLVRTKSISHS